MKNVLVSFLSAALIISCHGTNSDRINYSEESLLSHDDSVKVIESVHNDFNSRMQNAYLADTVNLINAPVKVITARPVKEEYSSYKSIKVTYKNISGKTISAIKFHWYGLNAFNEPADMGSSNDGLGSGFTDDELKAGKTDDGTWSILSRDLKKVTRAWPYEVAFKDGTKWELQTK